MYKKQLVFQKIVCLFSVIAAAVSFVYSLGILTDIYDSLFGTIRDLNRPEETQRVAGAIIFFDMQDFNRLLVIFSIGLILLACLLFLTNTNSRRKYYIGNYIATGLFSAGTIAYCVWMHMEVSKFRTQFYETVDFEALRKYAESHPSTSRYLDNTFMLDCHYVVMALLLIAVVGLIVNLVLKIRLMKSENRLIAEGKGVAV